MLELSPTLIYWYISIGLLFGYISRFIFGRRSIRMLPSIFIGAMGSVTTGIIAQLFNLGDTLIMGLIGAIGFLFICNIFHNQQHSGSVDIKSR